MTHFNLHPLLLTLFCCALQAQQNTASFITTSSYIQNSNLLSTVTALNNYRASIGLLVYSDDEISDNSAYYKFSYLAQGASTPALGLLDIRCTRNNIKTKSIEEITEAHYSTFTVDENLDDYTKEYIKTGSVHAGYFFNQKGKVLYLIMLSQPNKDYVFASLRINGLTLSQRKALARDFIENTVFQ